MPPVCSVPADFLPGTLTIERGTPRDYRLLEHFHYTPKRPATWAGVWVARYRDDPPPRGLGVPPEHCDAPAPRVRSGETPKPPKPSDPPRPARVVAVAVLSYPFPRCGPRERHLGLNMTAARFNEHLTFLNTHVRTISRVIVHPQFRSMGLAASLVRRILDECPTRYVESQAVMARAHPMFDAAGMTRIDPPADAGDAAPVYFIFDRYAKLIRKGSGS